MSRSRQRGVTMVELLIVLALTIAAAWQAVAVFMDKAQTAKAEIQGGVLGELNNALGTYITNNYNALVNGTAVSGVTNAYAPTVAELVTLGVLNAGFQGTNMYGGTYGISVFKTPTGCVAPACDVASHVWLSGPIRNSEGTVDTTYAASAALAVGANGAFSSTVSPGTMFGPGGTWNVTNPLGSQAGAVLARNGFGSQGFSQFLRRDGSLPMTGNLDAGGQSINNGRLLQLSSAQTVGAACSTGQIGRDAGGQVLACVGGVWSEAGGGKWKSPATTYASLPTCNAASVWDTRVVQTPTVGSGPRAYTCNGTSWQPLAVNDSGNLTMTGTVTAGKAQVTDIVTVGATCSPNGLVAMDSVGLLLSCQSGIWKQASGGGAAGLVSDNVSTYGNMYTSKVADPNDDEYMYIDNAGNLYECDSGFASGCSFVCNVSAGTAECGNEPHYSVTVGGIRVSWTTCNGSAGYDFQWCPVRGVNCGTVNSVYWNNSGPCL